MRPLNDTEIAALALHGFSVSSASAASDQRVTLTSGGASVWAVVVDLHIYSDSAPMWEFTAIYERERGWTTGSRDTQNTEELVELLTGGTDK